MSSVSAIGYAPSTTPNTQSPPLSQSDFLKVLVANLKDQNPLNPQQGTDYYKDIMQLSTYQSTLNMENNTSKLVNTESLKLIGQTVNYYDPNNNNAQTTGVVDSITFDGKGGTKAVIGGNSIDVGYINSVMPSPGSVAIHGA